MKQIKQATHEIIDQLTDLAGKMAPDEFARPLPVLLENSIGMHYRHIIEFYEVMMAGAEMKAVNYDSREHDPALEQSRDKCLDRLNLIRLAVDSAADLNLDLQGSYALEGDESFSIPTSTTREMIYNLEHAIHHMAIIRMALQQAFPHIHVGETFGFAYSTLTHIRK